jgi:hypothetical protein
VNTSDVVGLFVALGRAIPALPKALCRNHLDVFDSEDPEKVAEAVTICTRCPEFDSCAAWVATQPPRSLSGVIAGKNRTTPTRKDTTS